MAIVLLGARLGLAAVLAVAGITKLSDLGGSRQAVAGFGVPQRPAWVLGTLLPLAELTAATALIPHFSAGWGAVAALLLLLAFSIAIAVNLLRGRTPECRCFGQVHSAPVSWRMVARNVALAAAACAIVAGEGSIAIGAAVALAAVLLWRRAPAPAEGLPVGTRAPEFGALPELLASGTPVLLVFGSRHCGPCLALAPELEQWRLEYADRLTVEVLEREDDDAETVFEAYHVDGTPSAILVGADGRIASSVAPGADAIRRLVAGEPAEPAEAMLRREVLVRLASAVAAVSPLLSFSSRAFAGVKPYRPKRCPDATLRALGGFLCGEDCKVVLSDPENCGLCGRKCPKGTICAGGNCIRGDNPDCSCIGKGGDRNPDTGLSYEKVCCRKGGCVKVQEDKANCGGCGKTCTGVRPGCCQGSCHDLANDPLHCGGCFKECPPDKPLCAGGKCVKECPTPLLVCGNRCGNPKSQRCCGVRLYDKDAYKGDLCCNGKMVKPIKCGGKSACPETCCKGTSVDVQSDPNNCGRCGNVCGATVPPAPDNFRCCKGECVNIQLSNEHCNGCFQACPEGTFCRFGECAKGA